MKMPSAKTRRYVYRVTTAGLLVLGVYGVIDGNQTAAFVSLLAAVTGLADANVDTSRDE